MQRLPDHHNFNNSRCHVDVVCSLENSHIADNPLCYEEKDSLEIDERLPCVYVNDSSTEPSPTSNSSPLNNGGGKSKFFRMCCKVTLILSMFTIVAIGLATGSKCKYKKLATNIAAFSYKREPCVLLKYPQHSVIIVVQFTICNNTLTQIALCFSNHTAQHFLMDSLILALLFFLTLFFLYVHYIRLALL